MCGKISYYTDSHAECFLQRDFPFSLSLSIQVSFTFLEILYYSPPHLSHSIPIRTFLSIRILQAGKISSSCIWTSPLASCQNPADQCNYAHILSHDHFNTIKNMIMIISKDRKPPSFPPPCNICPRSSFYTCTPLGSFEHFEMLSKSRLDLCTSKNFLKYCPNQDLMIQKTL